MGRVKPGTSLGVNWYWYLSTCGMLVVSMADKTRDKFKDNWQYISTPLLTWIHFNPNNVRDEITYPTIP